MTHSLVTWQRRLGQLGGLEIGHLLTRYTDTKNVGINVSPCRTLRCGKDTYSLYSTGVDRTHPGWTHRQIGTHKHTREDRQALQYIHKLRGHHAEKTDFKGHFISACFKLILVSLVLLAIIDVFIQYATNYRNTYYIHIFLHCSLFNPSSLRIGHIGPALF
jgi:hypothetical protein